MAQASFIPNGVPLGTLLICGLLAGGLLAIGWQLTAPPPLPNYASAPVTNAAPAPRTSTLAPTTSAPAPASAAISDEANVRARLEQNLFDYRYGNLEPDAKRKIKQALHELARQPHNRSMLVAGFFRTDAPQLAEALYRLISDADLRDLGLLEQLIERDRSTPQTQFSTRIVNLITELGQQDRYSPQIDSYLAQMASSANPELRVRAATQRLWYLNLHQPYNLSAQEKYLNDSSATVREEVYSLLEARLANQAQSSSPVFGQAQLVAALHAARFSAQTGGSTAERTRIDALLRALGSHSG